MKKRIFSVLMFLLMTIALVACSTSPSAGDTGNQTDNNQIIDPQTDPLAFLEAAGEKLRNADSFETNLLLTLYTETQNLHDSSTLQLYNCNTLYVAELNGAPATFTTDKDGKCAFFHKNIGYSDIYFEKTKHISEETFHETQLFWILSELFDITSNTVFDDFCNLNPSVIPAEDGSVTFHLDNISYAQFQSLVLFADPSFLVAEHKHSVYSACITVDPQGTVNRLLFTVKNPYMLYGANHQIRKDHFLSLEICFSQINKGFSLQAPDWADTFLSKHDETYYIAHHFAGYNPAIYKYNIQNTSFDMIGITPLMGSSRYVTPVYTVLTELDNFPVQSAELAIRDDMHALLERMIVPCGVICKESDTGNPNCKTVFFEDEQGNVIYKPCSVQAYFSGEWEYVDGMPTPIA